MMILFGLFVKYDDRLNGFGPESVVQQYDANGIPSVVGPMDQLDTPEALTAVSRVYPLYQDVHVMIFIGFGFLVSEQSSNSFFCSSPRLHRAQPWTLRALQPAFRL